MKFNTTNQKGLKHFVYEIKGDKEKEWHYLAHSKIQYTKDTTTIKEYTFEECYNAIKNGEDDFDFYPIYTNKTLFTKQPRICFYDLFSSAFTQKQMGNKITLRVKAIDESHSSMQDLMREMQNEEFIEYLKDKNIQCPLLQK